MKDKGVSSKPSQPPTETVTEMKIPAPVQDKILVQFLGRHKIGKRQYEITAKIGDIIFRAIGGRQRAIETLKFSRHPDAQKLLEFCEKLSWNTRQDVPIEALCLAAGVDPTTVAGALVMAARDVSRLESSLKTFAGHADVVQATIRDAVDRVPILNLLGEVVGYSRGSSKAQEMMHKAVGWLPQPKGSSININTFGPPSVESDDEDDGTPTMEDVFGSDAMEIEGWGEQRRRLLEAGK